jgi:phosphoribosylglycinamide formyltransferase-1
MAQRDYGDDSSARDRAMLDCLHEMRVQLVVCAGYDRILSDEFLSAFPNAILNVHPSLLPAFAGGMRAVEDALAYGVKVTGCTIQLLEHGEPDGGPIVLQAPVAVMPEDTVDTLRQRIHEREWRLLPEAVRYWSEGRLRRVGRRVVVEEAGPAAASAASSTTSAAPTHVTND